jgi:hypothetical protein
MRRDARAGFMVLGSKLLHRPTAARVMGWLLDRRRRAAAARAADVTTRGSERWFLK